MTSSARLDRWLWAARFYKTRAQAKLAVEGGKVRYDGARTKPARNVAVGAELRIRRELDEVTVVIESLSERRGGAVDARRLYTETSESIERREAAAALRRAAGRGFVPPETRPTKRDRRALARLSRQDSNDAP